MAVGVDRLGLPEIILGDPETVAFRAVGRRRETGGHLGAAVFAQSVVAQALGHGADGHAHVAIPQQRTVRQFAGGHEHGRCVKDPGVSSHLTEGFCGHVKIGLFLGGARRAQEKPQKQHPERTARNGEGEHRAVVLQADPWTGPGATPRDLIKGSVPPIYTKGATLNYFTYWKEAPRGEIFWVCGRVVAPRDRSCARREARGRKSPSRCARGVWVIASNARSGSVPLLPPSWLLAPGCRPRIS